MKLFLCDKRLLEMKKLLTLTFGVLIAATPVSAADIDLLVRSSSRVSIISATAQLRRDTVVLEEHLIGSNGRLEFRNLNQGTYSVRIRAEGFLDHEVPVLLIRPNAREIVHVELQAIEHPTQGRGALASVYDLQVPSSAKKEYEQGLKERDKSGCSRAMPRFEKALAIFGQYADALNEEAKCLQAASRFDQAEAAFQKAIQYGSSIFPYINLADLYAARGRPDDAREVILEGIRRFPAEGDLQFALAKIFYDQGRLQEAEQAGLEAHSRFHRAADVHVLLAKIYLAVQKHDALVSQLKLYLAENPKGPLADRVRQNLTEIEAK
jgi:tetratricopeptide (TPR) repeat protein